jgi:hypothetical protein
MGKTRVCFGISILILITSSNLFAQFKKESPDSLEDHVVLYGAYEYRDLFGDWNINYFGVTIEDYLSNGIGMSGSIYYGKASDNRSYIHVPPLGLGLVILLSILDGVDSQNFILIFFENLHYNFLDNKNLVLSPYINILGADLGEVKDGDNEGPALLSTGIGCYAKLNFAKRWTIAPDLSLKYFFVGGKDVFGQGNQFGYAAGIRLGYNFKPF